VVRTRVLQVKPKVKWVIVLCGAAVLLVAAIVVFVIVDFPGHEANHLIRRAVSPDGRSVAELREVVTPMHRGPDMLQVDGIRCLPLRFLAVPFRWLGVPRDFF
jgi:hypothetical protein